MKIDEKNSFIYQHIIDLPHSECVFCAAQETSTGKIRLFLIFKDHYRIYIRNGLKDTWDEVQDERQHLSIRNSFTQAITERKVPCYSAMIM